MKKVLAILISVCIILSMFTFASISTIAETSGNFMYEILDDGTAEITHYNGTATTLEIPSEFDGYTVTSIGDSAFEDCTSLTSVTIPDSVTSIGDWAFYYCTKLTSVTIPNSVTSIGDSVFYNCTSLTSVTIPDSVTSIGDSAFEYCTSLTSVTIPDSVTSIGDRAFYNTAYYNNKSNWENNVLYIGNYLITANYYYYDEDTDDLEEFEVSGDYSIKLGTKVIATGAFIWCELLTSITIPDSVTSIGYRAFENCTSLTSINVNNNNKNYSDINGVLFNKEKTELIRYLEGKTAASYTIPNSVTEISKGAFYNCESLTSITVPDSVTSIGDSAFYGCILLTSVTIPNSVTSIGYGAFENCESLTSVTIPNGVISVDEGVFSDCTSLTSITIPDSVTSIGYEAFSGCTSLISITIGNSVTSIGDFAFDSCTSLASVNITDIKAWCNIDFAGYYSNPLRYAHNLYLNNELVTNLVIPNTINEIKYSFSDCTSLTSVTIPDSVTIIDKEAFENCTSLTSITIPNSITSIGSSAFYNTAYYNNKSNWENNVLYIGNYLITANYYYYDEDTDDLEEFEVSGDYSIKLGTKVIADNAFYNCDSLTSITIPSCVTRIADDAFSGCTSLTSVTIPNSVTSIGYRAFENCTLLTSVTIPNSVTSIGGGAFDSCTSLTSINVNSDNKSYCDINGVLFNKDKTELIQYPLGKTATSYTIPDSVTSIGKGVFSDCTSLTSITIPNSVTSIGDWAFFRCVSLTSIIIPNSVISIGFRSIVCDSLTSITIPDSVTSIDREALGYYYFGGGDCEEIPNFIINGYKGSAAEKYANDNGFKFVDLNTNPTQPTQPTTPINPTQPTQPSTAPSQSTTNTTTTQPANKATTNITSTTTSINTTLASPKVKFTSGKNALKIKYTKASDAVGFQVRYKIKGKWIVKNFNTKKSATKTIKNLKKGKYKIQIRTFTKGRKAYSSWTKTKTVKVK